MIKIDFQKPKDYDIRGITEQEVDRLISAYESGEELFYEEENGARIVLDQEGTLHISGYEDVPSLFRTVKLKRMPWSDMVGFDVFEVKYDFFNKSANKIKALIKSL